MSKFLIIGDTHISGRNSENRLGDIYKDTLLKIEEIISLSKNLKVDGVLHGGDVFDSAIVSNNIVDDLVDRIEEAKIIWHCLRGNHDEIGHSPELSSASSLDHIFRRSKFIKSLTILESEDYIIVGKDYYHNIEENFKINGFQIKVTPKQWKIGLLHLFLTKKPFLPTVLHLPVKDFNTNLDIIFSYHNHQPFHIITDTEFVNVGAICRRDINEVEINPSVVLLDTEKREHKIIPLKSAKPGSEVFDLTKVTKAKAFEEDIDKFIASLQTTTFTELDLRGIVEEVGKQKEIDREIIDNLIERIGKYD